MPETHTPPRVAAARGHIIIPPMRWRDALSAVNTITAETGGPRWESITAAIAGVFHARPEQVILTDGRAGQFDINLHPGGGYKAPCEDRAIAALSSEIVGGHITCLDDNRALRAIDTWDHGRWARQIPRP